jgi:hypothetical protein
MLKSYEATLDHGKLQWLGEPPDVVKARIIVTVLEDQSLAPPSAQKGAGIDRRKRKTLGDIIEPIVQEKDWKGLK